MKHDPTPHRWYSPGQMMVWLLVLFFSAPTLASSVREVSLTDMTSVCEVIFEGRVTGQQVKAGNNEREIVTQVTFEVLDVIKGKDTEKTIELSFLGGTLNGRSVTVSDLHLPQLGEHGIYFVEAMERNQINPLCAWDQGRYLVEHDLKSGQEIVKTSANRTVYGVDLAPAKTTAGGGLSTGVARGMRLYQSTPDEQPLAVETFKQQLRALVGGGQ